MKKPPYYGGTAVANIMPKNSSGETFPNIYFAIFFSCKCRYHLYDDGNERKGFEHEKLDGFRLSFGVCGLGQG